MYEQEQPEFDNPPSRHEIIGVDVVTNQVHVVPVPTKHAEQWEEAIDEIVSKMWRPKIIMTDPVSSMTGVVIDEWFKRNDDINRVLARHHARRTGTSDVQSRNA